MSTIGAARMKTWGTGLYDNDASLRALSALIGKVKVATKNVAQQAVGMGLRFWMQPTVLVTDSTTYVKALETYDAWKENEDVREVFERYVEEPESVTESPRSRSEETRKVLGPYCAGTFHPALFQVEGAQEILHKKIIVPCTKKLARIKKSADLEGSMEHLAHLGPLLELLDVGILEASDLAGADDWLARFDLAYTNTSGDAAHWREFVQRVRPGFHRLAAMTGAPVSDAPIRKYVMTERYSVGERIGHKKFGEGVVRASHATSVHVEFPEGVKHLVHGR